MPSDLGSAVRRRSRDQAAPVGRMQLTSRDRALLADVFLMRALTRKHLVQLGHFTSTTAANIRLRTLFDHGYVRRTVSPTGACSLEAVYYLGHRAINEVTAHLGVEREEVVRVAQGDSPFALAHALAVADVRLALQVNTPNELTAEWISEPQARHEYTTTGPKGREKHVLKPDGALTLTVGTRVALKFIEVDRGHVSQPQFARMCDSYNRYQALGLVREVYGTDESEILCVVHAGERRIAHLMAVAAQRHTPMRLASHEDIQVVGVWGEVWRSHSDQARSNLVPEVR